MCRCLKNFNAAAKNQGSATWFFARFSNTSMVCCHAREPRLRAAEAPAATKHSASRSNKFQHNFASAARSSSAPRSNEWCASFEFCWSSPVPVQVPVHVHPYRYKYRYMYWYRYPCMYCCCTSTGTISGISYGTCTGRLCWYMYMLLVHVRLIGR